MSGPAFARPTSLDEAFGILAADPLGTKVISGGTAVVLMLRHGLIAPDTLVSIGDIPNLRGIGEGAGQVRIGGATPLSEVAASALVRAHAPSLAYACAVVGNPRVRNAATLGGNLAEADYASDPPAVLACIGAICHIVGPAGAREVPVADLITGFYETVLDHAELITSVLVPIPTHERFGSYLKYRTRSTEDRACVGVAARVDLEGDTIVELDVVVAAVAPTLQRIPDALMSVRGRPLDAAAAQAVSAAYADAIEPMDDQRGSAWYRRRMIRVFVRRAIEDLSRQRAEGGHRG